MKTITLLTEQNLEEIRNLAALRYSISQIALMIGVDVAEFRLALQNPDSDISRAYNSGKLMSTIKRRKKLLELADRGSEWAMKLLDRYENNQREDELMP